MQEQKQMLGEILTQALPYIQRFYNKTIVVKYGGNAMQSDDLVQSVMGDLILLNLVGMKVVLVHGGGPEISEMLKKIGKQSRFINGLRYTDSETMDIVQMILAGKVNKDLVSLIEQKGGSAAGFCGLDGSMLICKKYQPDNTDYGYVGEIVQVNTKLIDNALDAGVIPVIASIGKGEDGSVYNINSDLAASGIAAALGAVKLIILTDTKGLMRDVNDPQSLINRITREEAQQLIRQGVINGGMIPKINCCLDALAGGVSRAHIIDGRVKHSIIIEMLTDEGTGTMIE